MGEPLTYPEVGATGAEVLPRGYHHLSQRWVIGTGPEAFERAAAALMRWDVHRAAGLHVPADCPPAAIGVEVRMRIGPGRLSLPVPCRVVSVLVAPDERGFAYGTLPGHPESGEELFAVRLAADGRVWFGVRAFYRPGRALTRLAGPAGRVGQRIMTARYAAAARRAAAGSM